MKVTNHQNEAHLSKIGVEEFGQAMKKLDLSTVPEEKRADAIKDHLMGIMSDTILNPSARFDIAMARQMYKRTKYSG
tara:strand:+ start:2222 stop:2452 length:231 start_codon:yes stop_codon:yes gene_type:complete